MAIDLKKAWPGASIFGVDKKRIHQKKALHFGYVNRVLTMEEALKVSDLVILALPVNVILHILPKVLSKIKSSTVVMDVGSTKGSICQSVEMHPGRRNFVACHPMAGTENSGPEAALKKLFDKKVVVICDKEKSSKLALKKAQNVFLKLGMRVVFMSSTQHDVHVAYISHVSHVVSYVLAITVLNKEKSTKAIFDLASSGFQSTVRLAKSHSTMWCPIFIDNSENITGVLDNYINNLRVFRNAIATKNPEKLGKLIERANVIRRVLK